MHAIVGPHSRLYSVSWSGDDERPLARIGWQLDRTLPADRALEAIGCTGAWPAAAAFWASLLGRPVDPRRGPWSLDLTLGSVPRWRLGSTNWARDVEDSGKRTRLAAVVDQRGGDRRFAEGLYKLIQSAVPPGGPGQLAGLWSWNWWRAPRAQPSSIFACPDRGGNIWSG